LFVTIQKIKAFTILKTDIRVILSKIHPLYTHSELEWLWWNSQRFYHQLSVYRA